MRLGCAADHSPPSSAAVMDEYNYTSTHSLGHTGSVTGTLYLFTEFGTDICCKTAFDIPVTTTILSFRARTELTVDSVYSP